MAFLLPEAAELVLGSLESGEAGNIVQGAETVATQFKNEIIKGGVFGVGEGALFGAGQSVYNNIKKDLGLGEAQKKMKAKQNCPIKKGRKMKRV
jgi:hypothetical protein